MTDTSLLRSRRRRRYVAIATVKAVLTIISIETHVPIVSEALRLEQQLLSPSRPHLSVTRMAAQESSSRTVLEVPGTTSRVRGDGVGYPPLSKLLQPSMFLSGGWHVQDIAISDLFASVRFGGRSYPQRERRPNFQGVLGFAIHDDVPTREVQQELSGPSSASFAPQSSTSLSSHRSGWPGSSSSTSGTTSETPDSHSVSNNFKAVSGVDSSVWNNLPKQLDEWNVNSSPLKNHLASTIFRNNESPSILPAWFPWLPTHTQICALKLEELKIACTERGIKKTGNKAVLQDRLWEWSRQQRRQRMNELHGETARLNMGLNLLEAFGTNEINLESPEKHIYPDNSKATTENEPTTETQRQAGVLKANSLAEWSRANLKPLLNKREDLKRQKLDGKKVLDQQQRPTRVEIEPTKEYLSSLTRAFQAPSSLYSNFEVSQMYAAAKHADQIGDRDLSKRLLLQLKEATPNDARIFRRLARMENEEGNLDAAISILQEGLRLHPQNAHLWQGLGNFQLEAGILAEARRSFHKAMNLDPHFPNPYHALGTLEHTHGNIASAMKVLKKGLEFCPTNHRLHHALGDLYREAKVLDMAEKSYRRVLQHGPFVSHCFAYSALACVAYENDNVDLCRNWLQKAVSMNHGRHAQGWVALAQFDESQGNIGQARAVSMAAVTLYERGLHGRTRGVHKERFMADSHEGREDNARGSVPLHRSGDRFLKVYRNWARLEERYGNEDTVEEVYHRALTAFPAEWKLFVDWADYHGQRRHTSRARELFAEACRKCGNRPNLDIGG